MSLINQKLQPIFRRAMLGGGLTAAALLTGCANIVVPNDGGCWGGGGMRVLGTGGYTKTYDEQCGKDKLATKRTEVDITVVEQLLKRQNDPVGNALGMLMAQDINPENRKKLEERMGGADKIQVAPETIIGLMTANNNTSRYVGFQLYAAAPEKERAAVDQLLEKDGMHRGMLASIPTNEDADNARKWATDHAASGSSGQGLPQSPSIMRTTTGCTRTRVGNQVVLDCPAGPRP